MSFIDPHASPSELEFRRRVAHLRTLERDGAETLVKLEGVPGWRATFLRIGIAWCVRYVRRRIERAERAERELLEEALRSVRP